MKILFSLGLLITNLIVNPCLGQSNSHYPTLILNDKYNQIQKGNSKVIPQNFELNSMNGFVLDCSKYDFSLIKKLNDNKLPDMVQIMSKSGIFTISLNAKGLTTIDKMTMKPSFKNNKTFSGFIKGDTAMLSIGTLRNNEVVSYWLGLITIK